MSNSQDEESKRRTQAHTHTKPRIDWRCSRIAATLHKRTKHVAFSSLINIIVPVVIIIIKDGCFSLCGNAFFALSLSSLSSIAQTRNQVGNKKRVNNNNNNGMYNVHIHKMREKRNVEFRWRRKKRHVETQNLTKKEHGQRMEKKIFNKIGNVCAQFFLSSFRLLCFIFLFILPTPIFSFKNIYGWN